MIKRATRVGLVIGVAAGLLAGCGEEEDPKAEYIADGDEICARGTFAIGQEGRDRYGTPQPPPKKQKEFTTEVIVPTLQTEVLEKLRELTPPEGDQQTAAAIYDALERGIAALRDDPELIEEPNIGGAFDEANRLAQAYGFQQCGRN